MANQKLSALAISSPRGTPDRTNDIIYVEKAGVSYGSTVNNELGISGNPVGDTDSQTLTSKILTAPTISSPVLSGTVTGTYTLAGTPTFPASVVTLTGSQTLTNKVLTSATLSSPTLTNASITADAISGFTSANTGTVYGIGVTAAVITTNNVVPNNALSNTSSFGSAWAWSSWTPTWTNMTIGNATVTAKYCQIGKLVRFRIYVTLGSTSAVSGAITFTLPITSNSSYVAQSVVGNGLSGLSVGSGWQSMIATWATTTTASVGPINAAASYDTLASTSSTVPFTWTTNSFLTVDGAYEAL